MSHIRNIGLGEVVDEFFAIRWLELRHHEGKPFLVMELGCSRGRIRGSYWGEDAVALAEELSEGDAVRIRGRGTEYKGQRWLSIESVRRAQPGEVSLLELLPKGRYTPAALWRRLEEVVDTVEDEHLGKLLRSIFVPESDFAERFSTYPAAKLWHGAYVGGLIEHTLKVARICDTASSFYPSARRDLLVAGALLHDIGKVEEISIHGFFDYTPRGRLLGHVVLGAMMVDEAIRKLGEFPERLRDELLHLVLSHHGELEAGSPVVPKTLEAIVLHHADMLDAQAGGVQHIIERDLPTKGEFSEYVKLLGRFIYLSGYRGDE